MGERLHFQVPVLIYGGTECEILAVLHGPVQKGRADVRAKS